MKQNKQTVDQEALKFKISQLPYTNLLSKIEQVETKMQYEQNETKLLSLQVELDLYNSELKNRKK